MSAKPPQTVMDLKSFIRDIPDHPKPGIIFKDITPLLQSPEALRFAMNQIANWFKDKQVERVVGIESRGFILGAHVAIQLNSGFIPARKKGKLPYKTESVSYALEYGEDTLEIHVDAIQKGTRVAIVDDLLATGGTSEATARLIQKLGGTVVGLAYLIELSFLNGRNKLNHLSNFPIYSLLQYN